MKNQSGKNIAKKVIRFFILLRSLWFLSFVMIFVLILMMSNGSIRTSNSKLSIKKFTIFKLKSLLKLIVIRKLYIGKSLYSISFIIFWYENLAYLIQSFFFKEFFNIFLFTLKRQIL